jgi:hypothetical protein
MRYPQKEVTEGRQCPSRKIEKDSERGEGRRTSRPASEVDWNKVGRQRKSDKGKEYIKSRKSSVSSNFERRRTKYDWREMEER